MRAKRINSDIAIIIFLFASGASDFTPACALAAESTGRNPGSTERHSGPPEWWQFKRKRATAMTIETKVSEHALRQSQRRGISRETLDLVLSYHDRSRKLPRICPRALDRSAGTEGPNSGWATGRTGRTLRGRPSNRPSRAGPCLDGRTHL
jgi:hypothetical protein